MPTLPTFDVTQAQADRLLAVFGGPAGYRAWLITQLKAAVMASEERFERDEARSRLEIKRARLDQDMTGIT